MSRTKDQLIDTITTWDAAIDGSLPAWMRPDRPISALPTPTDQPPSIRPTIPAIPAHDQRALSPPAGGDGVAARR
jgi:hypothetical protein